MIAYQALTNTLSIVIDSIDEVEEKIIFHFSCDNKPHKVKIYYTREGLPFFCFNGIRYHLSNFLRI